MQKGVEHAHRGVSALSARFGESRPDYRGMLDGNIPEYLRISENKVDNQAVIP